MITISLSFLSLGTNKYSGNCILGQPETPSFQNFMGEHALDFPRRVPKIFLAASRLKTFGHPTLKTASRALYVEPNLSNFTLFIEQVRQKCHLSVGNGQLLLKVKYSFA